VERRIGRVRIQIRHTILEIPWAVSRELVARLMAGSQEAERIADELNAVGVSRAAVIRPTDEPVRLAVVERWLADVSEQEHAPLGRRSGAT
jgi:hypothetical protein